MQASQAPAEPEIQLLESDSEHILLELRTSLDLVETRADPKGNCDLVTIADYGRTAAAGQPWLPLKGVLLGIPPSAEVTVRVLERETVPIKGQHNLCPVPTSLIVDTADGLRRYTGKAYVRDDNLYTTDRLYPPDLVQVTDAGYIRDQRIARLVIYPLQYNPATRQLWLHRTLKVEVRFPATDGSASALTSDLLSDAPSFEALLKNTLLNYAQARHWRKRPETSKMQTTALPDLQGPGYKASIQADGVYRLSYDDLQAAGLSVDDLDPRSIKLYHRGREVAIHVAGEDDGSFDPDDYIEFYAEAADTKYTRTNVYWLTTGSAEGLRMRQRDGHLTGIVPVAIDYPATVHFEEDHIYWPAPTPSSGRDYWYWTRLYATASPVSAEFSVPLPHVAPGVYTSTLRVAIKSRADTPGFDPDHHLRIFFNDRLVDDAVWNGEQVRIVEVMIPQADLNPITNTLRLEAPGDLPVGYDAIYLDWFEFDYHRTYVAEGDHLFFSSPGGGRWSYEIAGFSQNEIEVYDVSDPLRSTQIVSSTIDLAGESYSVRFEDDADVSTQYLALSTAQKQAPAAIYANAPSELRALTNGADYIVITHADFYTATLLLAEYRRGQGLRTMVIDVEDTYDEFNDGIFNPVALRDFLAYAYANWQPPAPSFVLLVGDGSLDFRDNLGTGEQNYVPPLMAQVDPWLGETASDNRYVTVSGDDPLPDMHIGRLPASTPGQVSAMIEKILDYEQASPPGAWRRQALFVADNADEAGDFAGLADDLVLNALPSGYAAQKVYYGVTHNTPAAAKEAIIEAINNGQLLVNYVGHAGVQFWAGERLFTVDDIGSLMETTSPPVMLPWTCYEGLFAYPDYPSLGESIVRAAGKGAVASWSPTGLGVALGHNDLASRLYNAVFVDGVTQIGPATTQAKVRLYTEALGFHELVDTYLLFGDPALRLAIRSPTCYDFFSPTGIGVEDIEAVAKRWQDADQYDIQYDVTPNVPDGIINVLDIITVAAQWGEQCL